MSNSPFSIALCPLSSVRWVGPGLGGPWEPLEVTLVSWGGEIDRTPYARREAKREKYGHAHRGSVPAPTN